MEQDIQYSKVGLTIALYQITGRGTIFSLKEIKEMPIKELIENWNLYSNPKYIHQKQ